MVPLHSPYPYGAYLVKYDISAGTYMSSHIQRLLLNMYVLADKSGIMYTGQAAAKSASVLIKTLVT